MLNIVKIILIRKNSCLTSDLLLNKNVLVTGGTGTFGQAFVRKVLNDFRPNKLIILSRDENKQYLMSKSFSKHPRFECLRFLLVMLGM